jgi:hypothetical protein
MTQHANRRSPTIASLIREARKRVRERTQRLRAAIDAMDYVTSGTLHTRTKVCGRSNCRCSQDPAARHGPYYEWSRREQGRLVHNIVSREQAALVADAIHNYRRVQELLGRWEKETVREILTSDTSEDT